MRILLTNNTLALRAGTECYSRDVAMALRAAGHEPMCYSRALGEIAEEIRAGGVPVFEAIENVPAPDVIHGHHRLETTVAGLFFPQAPVISFRHGLLPWQEEPCRLPNVALWIAVSAACLERLISVDGIAPERTRLLLNFVDLQRFAEHRAPSQRLSRAAIVSNEASENTHVPAVRAACQAAGIATTDVFGIASGNSAAHLEKLLPRYDIVFAKGRTALEAMAAGCAVILCDYFGAGHLVTPENFDQMRMLNFGLNAMRLPLDPAHLLAEIQKYDPQKTHAITTRVRAECSLSATLPKLIALYHEARAIAGKAANVFTDGAEMSQSAALFLQSELVFCKVARESPSTQPLQEEIRRLRENLAKTGEQLRQTRDALQLFRDAAASAEKREADLRDKLAATCTKLAETKNKLVETRIKLDGARRERAHLQQRRRWWWQRLSGAEHKAK